MSQTRRVVAPRAGIRASADPSAPYTNELLFGEVFRPDGAVDGDAIHGRSVHDDYPGWIAANALGPDDWRPTHRVIAPATILAPAATFKAPPLCRLSMGALVAVDQDDMAGAGGAFARLVRPAGYVPSCHIAPIGQTVPDWAATAAAFVGVPYLWGGRSADGIDCSGLVQIALALAGIASPRDTPEQSRDLGRAVSRHSALRRGDLVFMPGHVAIMQDGERAVSASSDPMVTLIEPVARLAARVSAREGAGITGVRRPDPPS